jgi:hypothetical protein
MEQEVWQYDVLSQLPLGWTNPTVVMLQAISEAERVIREYRRVEVNKMAAMVNISNSSDNLIVHGVLQLHEIPARWTPNHWLVN